MIKVLLAVTFAAGQTFGGPIENLKPGEWYMVPNSRMDALDPCPARNCCYSAVEGISAVMNDWSGGAFDTKRNRLMVWGGGHCGYAGNEIYAFSIDSLKWSMITPPLQCQYLLHPECGPTCQSYGDSTPSARHAYDGLEYLPEPVDGFFSSGGAVWGAGGAGCTGGSGTWIFKIATGAWEHKAAAPDGRNGNETAFDPATGHVFQRGNCWLAEYDPANNTWATRYNGGSLGCFWSYDGSGEIDPKRKLMVFTGNSSDAWGVYNLTTRQYTRPATSGDNSIQSQDGGIVYDPVSDRLVAWRGGTSVYTLNPDTWTWTRVQPAATSTVIPTAGNSNGTFGRWRYVPSKNVFIGVNAVDENVYIYRLTAGTGTDAEGKGMIGKGEGRIHISPNPARRETVIRVEPAGFRTSIGVFTADGRRVGGFAAAATGSFPVNLENFATGVYLIQVRFGGKMVIRKLLVQK